VLRDRKAQAAIFTAVAQGLERERGGKRVEATSAVFLGDEQPLKTALAALEPEVTGKYVVAITLRCSIIQIGARESDDFLAQPLLVSTKRKIHLKSSARPGDYPAVVRGCEPGLPFSLRNARSSGEGSSMYTRPANMSMQSSV